MCTMAVDQERLVCEIVPELRAFPYHLRFTKAINCKIPEPRASYLRLVCPLACTNILQKP
jgi:hypothetical protein